MAGMSWADLCILAVVAVSVVLSLFRGLVRELVSLGAWVLAFWVAFVFHPALAQRFAGFIAGEWLRNAAAFLTLLVGTLIVGGIVGMVIGKVMAGGGLSGPDRLLGGAFGLARGLAIVALVALMLGGTPLASTAPWRDSVLLPELHRVAGAVVGDFVKRDAEVAGGKPPAPPPAQAER